MLHAVQHDDSSRQAVSADGRFVWWATAVLLLAAVFRLFMLHDVPPGLSQDEVLNADIVQFIRGGYHALFFREGFGHEPLYHYFSVPFQVLLGDNVLSMRLPAVTLGLLLVALTMRWTRREFGVRTAVLTGLGLAISWWPIVFSRVGIRPVLEPVLLVCFAWFWPRRPFLAGLFLGLSVYSYTGARVVFAIPLLLAAYFFLTRRRRGAEDWSPVRAALLVLGVSLLVALPLFFTLRADPTLQQRVDQLAGPLEALQNGDLQPIWQSLTQTAGVFSFTGDPRWTYTLPDRPLFDWGTAVFFYTGLLFALWRWRQPRCALVLIWLVVGLVPSAVTPQAPSTVRLVGVLPVVYLLPALGGTAVYRWMRSKRFANWETAVRPLVLTLLLAVVGVNGFRTIRDGFVEWPQAEITRLSHYQTVLLDIARHWQANPTENLVVAEAFFEPIDRDSLIRNLGSDPQARWVQTGTEVTGAIVWPAGGNGRFYVPEFAAVYPPLLAAAGIPPEPLFRSETQPSFATYSLPEKRPTPTMPMSESVSFANVLKLEGYEPLIPESGERFHLLTFWQVEDRLPADLRIFLHVIDEAGNLVAQHDGFDAAPGELWAGDTIIQHHAIDLAGASGSFELQIGVYTLHDEQRLQPQGFQRDIVVLTQMTLVDGK